MVEVGVAIIPNSNSFIHRPAIFKHVSPIVPSWRQVHSFFSTGTGNGQLLPFSFACHWLRTWSTCRGPQLQCHWCKLKSNPVFQTWLFQAWIFLSTWHACGHHQIFSWLLTARQLQAFGWQPAANNPSVVCLQGPYGFLSIKYLNEAAALNGSGLTSLLQRMGTASVI